MKTKKAVAQLRAIQKLVKNVTIRLAGEWEEPWKVLIATICSPQTRDEVTIPVCEKLFSIYPSMKELGQARIEKVEELISSLNFYLNKARSVVATAEILGNKKIPETIEELIQLPGVGRKVANVYINEALGAPGIAVDTHVARISQKLGWTKNTDPTKIEYDLMELFPKKHWRNINKTLVLFGKSIGTSRTREDEYLEKIKKICDKTKK